MGVSDLPRVTRGAISLTPIRKALVGAGADLLSLETDEGVDHYVAGAPGDHGDPERPERCEMLEANKAAETGGASVRVILWWSWVVQCCLFEVEYRDPRIDDRGLVSKTFSTWYIYEPLSIWGPA